MPSALPDGLAGAGCPLSTVVYHRSWRLRLLVVIEQLEPNAPYWTAMVASADLPPHVTSTLPFPSGWVCLEISQVQVSVPLASAVLGSSPVAVLVLPEGWV